MKKITFAFALSLAVIGGAHMGIRESMKKNTNGTNINKMKNRKNGNVSQNHKDDNLSKGALDSFLNKGVKKIFKTITEEIAKPNDKNKKAECADNFDKIALSEEIIENSTLSIEEELEKAKSNIGILLQRTTMVIALDDVTERFNCKTVLNNWLNALAGYPKLLEKFNAPAVDSTDESTAKEYLIKWLEELKNLGICEYKDSSADEKGNVTVTVDNRAFYLNGREYDDNSVASVKVSPWEYNGKLYCGGILSEVEN